MPEILYQHVDYHLSEFSHKYGAKVHILKSAYLLTLLSKLGNPQVVQPQLSTLLSLLYDHLLDVVISKEFPRIITTVETRMKKTEPQGDYYGEVIDPDQKCVSVCIARAGNLPSMYVYHKLNQILKPDLIRQDFLFMSRMVNSSNEVVGTSLSGSKIGGDIDNTIILFPDPMGATGGSIIKAIDEYKSNIQGSAKAFICMCLIVTPEFIQAMQTKHPDAIIYAIRLDRGLSASHILETIPGTYPNEERGLNSTQYIVPGAGGLGEVLNNSYV